MTTNVPRGAGRPAATAKRNRAAQRTPLPPRPGVVEAAREAIRESHLNAHFANMTVAELRAYARDHGLSTVTKLTRKPELVAALQKVANAQAHIERGNASGEAPGRPYTGPTNPAKRKEQPAKPARANGEAAEQPEATRGKAKAQIRLDVALGGTKSAVKAQAFCSETTKLGWAPDLRSGEGEDHLIVTATRGAELIEIEWVAGVFLNTCIYSANGRSPIKLRNASAAKMRMAVPAEKATEEAARVTAHKKVGARAEKSSEPTAPRRHTLPFTEASLDQEVLDALYGRRIYWLNSISGVEEDDRVPPLNLEVAPNGTVRKQSHQPRITEGTKDGRIISFVGAAGFRSVRLSSILRVGR